MYKIEDLPVIRAQFEQEAAAEDVSAPRAPGEVVTYARAPDSGTAGTITGRPPATQRTTR